jgi:hypothetical protein
MFLAENSNIEETISGVADAEAYVSLSFRNNAASDVALALKLNNVDTSKSVEI